MRQDRAIGRVSQSTRRRLGLAGAALLGAVVVGLAWFLLGGSTDTNASLAALGQTPNIVPPDYGYLDNARVALYLGQLEGGKATSEQLTQQLTKSGTASANVGGFSVGGSVDSSATAERVVTPTATASFYQLLDLLGRDGYLKTVDMAEAPKQIARDFARIGEGSFVRLQNCTVQLPAYVQLLQAARSPGFDYTDPLGFAGNLGNPAANENNPFPLLRRAQIIEEPSKPLNTTLFEDGYLRGQVKQLDGAIHALVRTVGSNPRVPIASCNGYPGERKPRGLDLLLPIQLANFAPEPGLLDRPVTVVGKVVLPVRNKDDFYFDNASLTTFSQVLNRLDPAANGRGSHMFENELVADAVVLPPGAVIIPIAIYR
jgi:hypothetical protein